MHPSFKLARTLVACDAIDRLAKHFFDEAHTHAAALEDMGTGAMTNCLDSILDDALKATKQIRDEVREEVSGVTVVAAG